MFHNKITRFVTKEKIYIFIFFLIPVICTVLKGILFQGFVTNETPYSFNLISGYDVLQSNYIKYYIAFPLVFFSFSFLFKGKSKIIFIFIINTIITLLFLLDLWYFRGFQTVPSIFLITQTSNLDNMSDSINSMLSFCDLLFLVDFLVLVVFAFLTRKTLIHSNRSPKSFMIIFLLPLLFILYVPFNLGILNNKDVTNGYLFDCYDPTLTEKYFSTIGYHLIDAYTVYRNTQTYNLTDDDMADINSLFTLKNEDLPDNEYFAKAKGKNIIYVQVESLENFVINQKINNTEITPNLNKIINSSLYFPNTFEQVNEGTSSDADFMVNTSLLPVRRGCTFFRYPNNNYNSMPEILASHGYSTSAIHPDKGSFWNYQIALTGGIGFQKFTDYYSFDSSETIGLGISDKSYFTQVVPMIKNLPSPFYAMTVTLTNHGPFNLPDQYRQLNLDSELNDNKMGGYFESVHYTDEQIGNFLNDLKTEGLLDNTIIVFMGDHAGIHKYYDEDIDKLSNPEDWYLDNGNHTVPFIIYDPSHTITPKTYDTLYNGQIDVMPTLLYLLGIPKEEYENTCMGRNLLNTDKSYAIITDGTLKYNSTLSDDEINTYSKSLDISDKIIRANYRAD